MCLVTFSLHSHAQFPLIVVANRDEFYDRPTAAVSFWEDAKTILAGRDLLQKGSWMGVSKNGRFATITNFRNPSLPESGQLSRGIIVQDFLESSLTAKTFIDQIQQQKHLYGGLNLLVYDGKEMHHYNNVLDDRSQIKPGIHSISNHTLNTPWPKVIHATQQLTNALEKNDLHTAEQLISILDDRSIAPDVALPQTGVGIHLERLLSPLFVKMTNYGTRSTTVILLDNHGHIQFLERTFEDGEAVFDHKFQFQIS